MTRSFSPEPLGPELLDRLCRLSLCAPSAGDSQGVDWLVLTGHRRDRFFAVTCDDDFLAEPGPLAGLLRAPAVLLPLADPDRYAARYAESDKLAASGLGGLPTASWPVPYWLVDAAFATMTLLLAAEDAGLGALFFRLHRDPAPLLAELGAPSGLRAIGAVALGRIDPAGRGPTGSPPGHDRRSAAARIHTDRW